MLDFSSLARPTKPNSHLLAPDGVCGSAKTDGDGPVFAATPAETFAAARAVAEGMDGVTDVEADEGRRALAFVARTKLLRFKDDVDVRVVPDGDGAALAIYSRSRIGHSDLGANEKRVDAFVADVRARL